ncbi:MAG: carboxypeptidase-like regulatory domain-containing protein [Candidatus Doudnabacteria bacterium]|nr:carboxypeptidase-like regulatory domain-containing protein [Candidatus Doudnabacteria bacterium]
MIKSVFFFTSIVLLAAGCGKTSPNPSPSPSPSPIDCTQEARQCPDGSYVSRSGPNCEFAACPSFHAVPTSSAPSLPPPSLPAKTGGINGYVHTGPSCPVQKDPPDPNCADKPYVYIEVAVIGPDGKQVQIQTDSYGKFSLPVLAGTYTVKVIQESMLPRCEEKTVAVTGGKPSLVDISCDTGIR